MKKMFNWLFKSENPTENVWKQSIETIEHLDPEKYNCCMMINGEMTFGILTTSGPSYVYGLNNKASGGSSNV